MSCDRAAAAPVFSRHIGAPAFCHRLIPALAAWPLIGVSICPPGVEQASRWCRPRDSEPHLRVSVGPLLTPIVAERPGQAIRPLLC